MSSQAGIATTLRPTVIEVSGLRALLTQTVLVAATVALPVLAHLTGAPVRFLLPMLWPVLFAGLAYGWRMGLLTGLMAPLASFAISGFPMPAVIPAMTLELAVAGFAAGILVQRYHWNTIGAVVVALLASKLAFLPLAFATGWTASEGAFLHYLWVAMGPGLIGGLFQIILLPLMVMVWVKNQKK